MLDWPCGGTTRHGRRIDFAAIDSLFTQNCERMFQLAQPSPICVRALIGCAAARTPDRVAMCGVIALDPALLSAALRWLGCAATSAALAQGLDALDDHSLRELTLLLADTGTHHAGPRSAQRWHAGHRLSVLAEALAREVGLSAIDQRLQTTLDLAGIDSVHAAQLDDIGRYRGYAVDDLVDARVGLRMAVTLAAAPELRAEYGAVLFGIDAARWQRLEACATDAADAQLTQLQLPAAWTDADEAAAAAELALVLPRLEVVAYWAGHPRLQGERFDTVMMGLVEAALQVPAAMYSISAADPVLRSGARALEDLPVSRDNARSKVATALDAEGPFSIARWDTTAAVDQQVMTALGCEVVYLTPVLAAGETRGVLLTGLPAALDAAQASLVLGWYAGTIGHSIAQRDRTVAEREQQARLQRADHERLLREAVHEANNPLAIVHNYLHIVLGRVADDPSLSEPLQIVLQEIDRTAAILQRLVAAHGPRQLPPPAFAHLPDLVADIGRLFEPFAAARNLVFEVHAEGEAGVTIQDADVVRQILTNLLRNGAEALAPGGRLRITCRANVFRNGRRQAVITVADDGPGIPLDFLQSMLEPKTTGKGAGHAGVGLALAHRLAAQLHASLDCESGAAGTAFTLMLDSAN